MTLSMTLVLFVISSQIGDTAETSSSKDGKGRHHSEDSIALLWTAVVREGEEEDQKRKPKRDLPNVTCFGCDKKGHVITHCPYRDKKEENPERKQGEKPKPGKGARRAPARSPRWGLFIQQCHVVHYS
jgi:hypothetical protein